MSLACARPPYAGELKIDQRVIGPQGVGNTAHASHKVTRPKAVLSRARLLGPQRNQGFTAAKPPVFIEVVTVEFHRGVRGQYILVQGCRVDWVKVHGQQGTDPLTCPCVNDAEVKILDQ
jgi:hypothetical protein